MPDPARMELSLTVNGERRTVSVAPMARLLDVLREALGLTGTKEGCGEGECGACAVILDGELVNSCLVVAAQARGAAVTTVEGLLADGEPGALQRAFVAHGAAQCGICTPGMLVAARCFLDGGAPATGEAVREAIAGNLCRCTGYVKIVEAIQDAAGMEGGAGGGAAVPEGRALAASGGAGSGGGSGGGDGLGPPAAGRP